jgi:hypothetical protein
VEDVEAQLVPPEVEEQLEVRHRFRPLVERRNWQAAQLPLPVNAPVRAADAAVEVAADAVGPLRLRYLRIPVT